MKRTPLVTLNVEAAAKQLGMCEQKLYALVNEGKIRSLVGYEHTTFSKLSILRAKGKIQ